MLKKFHLLFTILSLFILISCVSNKETETIQKVPVEIRPVEIYYDWDKYKYIE